MARSEHSWKMRSAKGAQYCSKSSISHIFKIVRHSVSLEGLLEDEIGKNHHGNHLIISIIMATTSSCKKMGSVRDRERVNAGLKTLSGAKPCLFFG